MSASEHDTRTFDERTLAGLAGPRSFARGEEYAAHGAVGRLEVARNAVLATVQGTDAYRVRLGLSGAGGRLTFSCSCPVGADGGFCKHCVAVGLCWLRQGEPARASVGAVREHLLGLSVERLVDLVLDHAREDPRLAERLDAMALRASEGPVDLAAYRALLDRALTVHGYVSYREAWGFFEGIDAAIDAVAALLEDGHAAEVVELTEHAVRTLDASSGSVDDSDGGTTEALERLEDLHHDACTQAQVDPVGLAERLFACTIDSDLGVWSDGMDRYAEVLGEPGLERYRELVTSAWSAAGDGQHQWLLTSLAEQLARRDGDVDRLVAIKARDLTDAWGYWQIVEVLVEAKRADDALRWAEQGVAAQPVHYNPVLRNFVAEAYRRAGRGADAVGLRVDQLTDTPSLDAYRALRNDADALGQWPERREAALTALRAGGTTGRIRRDRSTLVEIFLWEGDERAAWDEAQAGGCSPSLWRRLALARADTRPQDAVAVYRMLVGQTVGATNNHAYEHAVELLAELEQALAPTTSADAHRALVADVRDVFRRKRNFVKLLDARWPAAPA